MANQITDNLYVPYAERGTYQIEPFASELDALEWIKAKHLASLVIIVDKGTLAHLASVFGRRIYPSGEIIPMQVGDEAMLIHRMVTRSRVFGRSVSYHYALCRRVA